MKDLTVLLAEDDDQQALLITQALNQNAGVSEVIRFQNGQDILTYIFMLADDNRYGEKYVLLLDIQMPGINGIEVLKAVKKHVALKILPVIMFSSDDDPRVMNLCYQYGCNAFITKPLDYDEYNRLSMLDFISVMQVPAVPTDIISKIASGVIQ
jgi:CheY-like chemotaxis protein